MIRRVRANNTGESDTKVLTTFKDDGPLKTIFQWALVAGVSGAIGYGTSQSSLSREMHAALAQARLELATSNAKLESANADVESKVKLVERALLTEIEARKLGDADRDRSTERMSGRLDELIRQNTELIAELRAARAATKQQP